MWFISLIYSGYRFSQSPIYNLVVDRQNESAQVNQFACLTKSGKSLNLARIRS